MVNYFKGKTLNGKMEQTCKNCDRTLSIKDFYYHSDSKIYEKTCKKCRNQITWSKLKHDQVKHHEAFSFICTKCKIQKTNEDFYLKDRFKKRYDSTCKNCRLANYRENIDHERKMRSEWHAKNREKNKELLNKSCKNRYHYDINYKLGLLLRQKCRKSILNKTDCELLDCDGIYARSWLEYQFSDIMSWENYGKIWNIDHIIPISSFNLTDPDQQKKCFNWKNIRPLLIEDNQKKMTKNLEEQELKQHNEKIEEFLNLPPEFIFITEPIYYHMPKSAKL